METNLCTMDKCDVCNDNECSSKEKNVPVIDIRQIIRSSTKLIKKYKDGKDHIIN